MSDEEIIARYQRCVSRMLNLFDGDPLPPDDPAHFYIERFERVLDLGLLHPTPQAHDREDFCRCGRSWAYKGAGHYSCVCGRMINPYADDDGNERELPEK